MVVVAGGDVDVDVVVVVGVDVVVRVGVDVITEVSAGVSVVGVRITGWTVPSTVSSDAGPVSSTTTS